MTRNIRMLLGAGIVALIGSLIAIGVPAHASTSGEAQDCQTETATGTVGPYDYIVGIDRCKETEASVTSWVLVNSVPPEGVVKACFVVNANEVGCDEQVSGGFGAKPEFTTNVGPALATTLANVTVTTPDGETHEAETPRTGQV